MRSVKQFAPVALGVGILSDILAVIFFYALGKMAYTGGSHRFLGVGLLVSSVFGMVGTTMGSVAWAWRASTRAVLGVVTGIILALLIYGSRIRFGFDDPKVMVIPFGGLVVLLLIIGRGVGYATSNRDESSAGSKTTR